LGFRLRAAGSAARRVAGVWAVYGVLEVLFSGIVPGVRDLVVTLVQSHTLRSGGRLSPAFAVAAIAIYTLTGAVLGAAMGLFSARGGPQAAGGKPGADGEVTAPPWELLGAASVALVFGVHGCLEGQWFMLPSLAVGSGLLALRAAFGSRWLARHAWAAALDPRAIVTLLVGLVFLSRPRPYMSTARTAAVLLVYAAAVWLVAAALRRFSAGQRLRDSLARHRTLAAAGGFVVLAACIYGAATVGRTPPAAADADRPAPPGSAPNVLLIILDTVRADHLSVYGYGRDTTPNLRRLARAATLYPNAIASSNYTLPTHASIFTGLIPTRHGVHLPATAAAPGPAVRMPDDCPTMPTLLRARGYRTEALVANTVLLVPTLGFDRGFARYVNPDETRFFDPEPILPYFLQHAVRRGLVRALDPDRPDSIFAGADQLVDAALATVDAAARVGRPLFLFMNLMDAHMPYSAAPPFDRRYEGRDPAFSWETLRSRFDEINVRHVSRLTERERRHLTSQYDGAIAFIDMELDRLFDHLRSLGVFDNTLVIVTSDHGEAFGEHGTIGHAITLYQEELHVPLLIKWPVGQGGTRVYEAPTSSVDLLPTVLATIGAPVPRGLDGESLLRPDRLSTKRWVVSECCADDADVDERTAPGHAVADLALFSGTEKMLSRRGTATELYDLSGDAGERANLLGARPPAAGWPEQMALIAKLRLAPKRLPTVDLDNRDRLRALGYIQ
jgi:arylsulfatase A-like enzyme